MAKGGHRLGDWPEKTAVVIGDVLTKLADADDAVLRETANLVIHGITSS